MLTLNRKFHKSFDISKKATECWKHLCEVHEYQSLADIHHLHGRFYALSLMKHSMSVYEDENILNYSLPVQHSYEDQPSLDNFLDNYST